MNPREEESRSGISTYHIYALVPPSLEDLNALVPAYEFLEFLDQGGMGVVYKARQKSLNRIVAVKTLPPANKHRRTYADRFKREAEALASLNHPNIVSVYDSGETSSGVLYYVMEFVQGSNLRRMMKVGQLSTRQMLAIITQVCGALQYAHDCGVVHRDIKPANILLDEYGNAKVADFGLAKVLGLQHAADGLTSLSDTLGTPDYIAPEALTANKDVDHRADIFSLGVMLYEMSTGRVPKGDWEMPSRCGADSRLDEVISRALQVDPKSRYQRVDDLTQELQKMIKEGDQPASSGSRSHRKPTTTRRREKSNAGAAPFTLSRAARWVVLLVLLCGAIAFWQFPTVRDWFSLRSNASIQKPRSLILVGTMQDQRALAKYVFAKGGVINVNLTAQKNDSAGDEQALRNVNDLPTGEFSIWRVSFRESPAFGDKELAEFLALAEKARSVSNLSLRGTGVTSPGLAPLSALEDTLTSLNIRNTSAFSTESLAFIASCGLLKGVYVTVDAPGTSRAKADAELVSKLQGLLPGCRISTEKSDSGD